MTESAPAPRIAFSDCVEEKPMDTEGERKGSVEQPREDLADAEGDEILNEDKAKEARDKLRAARRFSRSSSNMSPASDETYNVDQSFVITLRFGSESIRGKRPTQEDSHKALPVVNEKTCQEKMNEDNEEQPATKDSFAFFGVYDGHGGPLASDFVAEHLHKYVQEEIQLGNDLEAALKKSFERIENDFLKKAQEEELKDGTTAVVAIIKDNQLIAGNIGDSELVLCRNGVAHPVCAIHNPRKNTSEAERIVQQGGKVYHGRLAHPALNAAIFNIAVSRAIGDIFFKHDMYTKKKKSALIAEPDIQKLTLTPEDEFCILACDGLWDVFTHQEAVDFVLEKLEQTDNPQTTCEEMVKAALEKGSQDNITALIVSFKRFK